MQISAVSWIGLGEVLRLGDPRNQQFQFPDFLEGISRKLGVVTNLEKHQSDFVSCAVKSWHTWTWLNVLAFGNHVMFLVPIIEKYLSHS
jgi:hypothetical protein